MTGKATQRARLLVATALFAAVPAAQAILPIEQWRTPAGARVLFVESHDLPMFDVAIDFPAGASRDVRDKSGSASLTQRLMWLGVDGMTEEQISEGFADVGAQPSGRFDAERAGFALRTLSAEAESEAALGILVRMLQQPTFPEAVLEREKARTLAGLKESDSQPETMVDREFRRLVFGNHPYALRGGGEADTVSGLGRDDVEAFYRRHYAADTAVISIIGDLTPERARSIAERLTSGLPGTVASLPELPPVQPLASPQWLRLPHPSTQAHIAIGQPGIRRKDPDYFPLWLGNQILGGGGFSSRLNREIRQKRGFAYSTYSYFNPLTREGQFLIGLQTRKEKADEALAVAREVLAGFVADGPTQEELDAAKQNVVDGFPLRIDSNRKILDYLSIIGFYDLPLDYLEAFPARIEAITLEQVQDAWRRRIDPERMVTVVVGAPEVR